METADHEDRDTRSRGWERASDAGTPAGSVRNLLGGALVAVGLVMALSTFGAAWSLFSRAYDMAENPDAERVVQEVSILKGDGEPTVIEAPGAVVSAAVAIVPLIVMCSLSGAMVGAGSRIMDADWGRIVRRLGLIQEKLVARFDRLRETVRQRM